MSVLNAHELSTCLKKEVAIIDLRATKDFVQGFIKGSINIILNEHFIPRFEYFVEEKEIILVIDTTQQHKAEELIPPLTNRKINIHIANLDEWRDAKIPIDMIIEVDPYELKLDISFDKKAVILDVRNEFQYQTEHILGANSMPVTDFKDPIWISQIDDSLNYYIHCNGGTSSVLACSILKKHGFHNIRNIEGGLNAVRDFKEIPLKENKQQMN